jgi:hypothetical protein
LRKLVYLIAASFGCLGCFNGETTNNEKKNEKFSLTIADKEIAIDSIHAKVWYEDQLNKNMLTLKIYCTSSYPIKDKSVIGKNGYMRISAQAIAEPGTHFIKETGTSWNNHLIYEFPHTSIFSNEKSNSIYIPVIDFRLKRLTCKVNLLEYVPIKDRIAGKKGERKVVFYGENIPFTID